MSLSLPPENSTETKKRLQQLREEKKRLRDRIERIKANSNNEDKQTDNSSYEENMARLLEKKKQLEDEKQKQFQFKKMQEEYTERQKQMEREKRMEQLQNEKRMIELEVGMKRMVFESTKEKVKGMNSQQLMMRAMLRDGLDQPRPKPYTSKGNVRRDFQTFLQTEHKKQYKQKWDVHFLNEKRFEVFQKKEQAMMREVLLNQVMQKGLEDEIDVMKLTKAEVQVNLEQFGIDINDYLQQAFPKQRLVQLLPDIQAKAKIRILQHEKNRIAEQQQFENLQRHKVRLKQQLALMPSNHVAMVRSILDDLLSHLVFSYQKRLNRFDMSEFESQRQIIEEKYVKVLLQNQDYEYSKVITLKLLQKIHNQFVEETADEMYRLHTFAHTKTQQCFQWMFKKGTNIVKKLQAAEDVDFELRFDDDEGDDRPVVKNQIKKESYLKKFEDYQTNVFDVDKLTTEIINQINLLQLETEYFDKVSTKIHGQKQGPELPFHILYDRQLYVITNEYIHNAKKLDAKLQRVGINSKLPIVSLAKFHNFWIIHDPEKVSLYSPWGLEILKNEIGERIANNCGSIVSTAVFPIYNILGMTCSIVLGFEKGQLLKYNMNLNRVTNTQTNLSFYAPILSQIKSGEEPPFPLEKKNIIKVKNQKMSDNSQIHQFREFFDHHTSPIIGINFYKHNSFITVDKNLKCALWFYQPKEGPKCYSPAYTFEFVSSYLVYRESENPRIKAVYPGAKINETPQQLYKKWMLAQGFLRKQIYNNPKKSLAYFRPEDDKEQKGEVPVWQFLYDEGQKKVKKIDESYYTAMVGKMQAKSTKIWRNYLMILCEREHAIKQQFKTVKVYGWDIDDKKMRSINIEFDVFKNQASIQFQVLDDMLLGVDMQLLAVVSSGRILIFSLISGQLLRNISDGQYLENPKYSGYFFNQITSKKSVLGAATKKHTMEISLNDHNTPEKQKQLNELIEDVARKYINLV